MSTPVGLFRGVREKSCPGDHKPEWVMEKTATGSARRCVRCRTENARKRRKSRSTELERWWAKVDKQGDEDCWLWLTAVDKDGYGIFRAGGTSARAHRFGYEALIGPIPEGLVIDHLCRNTGCVNPAHMEPVTNAENIRRGYAIKACSGNHEPRWGFRKAKPGEAPYRYCLECQKERSTRWRDAGGREVLRDMMREKRARAKESQYVVS